jgi:hypothetical protein
VNNAGQYLAVGASVALLLFVLEMVRRRRLNEEYSFIWIVASGALIVLSIARGSIDKLALWLGIHYGPALLLLGLGFFVAVAALHFSLVVSRQRRQIERLIEDVALLDAQQRRLQDVGSPSPPPSSISSPRVASSGRQ